jgi:NitT/TauT family transport system substrate-binding protein
VKSTWKKTLGVLSVLTLSFALAACGSDTTTPADTKGSKDPVAVKIGSSSKGAVTAIQIEVAEALGYFKDAGVNADVIYFKSGTESATALIAGQIDFSVNAVDHAIKAKEQNKNIKMITSFTDKPANTLIVNKKLEGQVKTVADLKGKKIGVTGVGSGTHILTAYLLKQNGLALSDVEIVPLGSASNFLAAFKNNQIDAGMVFDPASTQLIGQDAVYPLVDMSDEEGTRKAFPNGGYQFTGLLTSEEVIQNKKDAAQRVVNALVKTNQYIASHSAEEIVSKLPADVVGKDKDQYVKSLAHTKPAISADGLVQKQAVQNNIESIKAYDTKNESVKTLDAASLFDMQFVNAAK